MALSHSPRKLVVPLSTGDNWDPRPRTKSNVPITIKRVFYCGVVVEGSEGGRAIPQDVQDLIASLGEPLDLESESESLQSPSTSNTNLSSTGIRRNPTASLAVLAETIKELVATERSYVSRLKILKQDYADPLRTFSRSKDTAILPSYEAKTLFGNIDNLLPVNQAFLDDLEKMDTPGGLGVGEVALKHFKHLKGFEHYKQYYSKREEAQTIFERESKKSSGFVAYIERIQYSSTDMKNRVGLRELLMEPVQRIPRYTLMFRTMLKHMPPGDPQRAALVEADDIASRIALAETDEQTKRAATMYCLSTSIEDFPPALVSHGRRFIDCIDVEDVLADLPLSSGSSIGNGASTQPGGNLHCTLFLFDDKLMIVKRPGNGEKSGRELAGLNGLEKMANVAGLSRGRKKSGMVCKGVLDIVNVVATDIGGSDLHLYLESPPQDQGDRWSGRPFRALSAVHPPASINQTPGVTEAEKRRFLENLWHVQGRHRTKKGQSVLLRAEEKEVENRGSRTTIARTYFNVYTRTAFLQEPQKTKVVLQIDTLGSADPIPIGVQGYPLVLIKVQPLAGDLSRYRVTSSDPSEDEAEDIVQTARVPDRVVHTIHQYGLFKFRTGRNSVPSTPTASRSRAAIFGLDAISRNLFNARPGSAMGDLFGGSTNSHRRSRTFASRSSVYTSTTATGDSSFSRFSRANSTTTAATSIDDESLNMSTGSSRRSRSISRAKKLIKRGKSPKSGESEPDTSPVHNTDKPLPPPIHARSWSENDAQCLDDADDDDDGSLDANKALFMDQSERDLALRLELARRNSQNQHDQQFEPFTLDPPIEDTLYEEDPPNTTRPFSRASRDLPRIPKDAQSQRSTTPKPDPVTPTRGSTPDLSPRRARSISRQPSDRRPMGPRTPSPMPPQRSLLLQPLTGEPSVDVDLTLDATLVNTIQPPVTPTRSPIPRSKRQPFVPAGNLDKTPKAAAVVEEDKVPGSVEPLSIKKKASVRSNATVTSPTHIRKTHSLSRSSPRAKMSSQSGTQRKTSGQYRSRIPVSQNHPVFVSATNEEVARLIRLAETTKEDIESSCRALKRIKLENDKLRTATPTLESADDLDRPASPVKGIRTPQRPAPPPLTKEAQARMEEMRHLIGRRYGDPIRARTPNGLSPMASCSSLSRLADTPPRGNERKEVTNAIDELVDQAEGDLSKAAKSHEALQTNLETLAGQLKEKALELDKTKVELQNSKRQCELVKSLLADCTAEKEILYEAFNEELDGMFNDANLPEDEAWAAMTKDLRETKTARNELSKENSNLKRRLAEVEMQKEEWGALLRAHGLIP